MVRFRLEPSKGGSTLDGIAASRETHDMGCANETTPRILKMKSATQANQGTEVMSAREAEYAAKHAEAEARAARAFFKESKSALKLARKKARNAKREARKKEKEAARARKECERLRKQAKKAVALTKKVPVKKAAPSVSNAPAKGTLTPTTLATLAPPIHRAASDPGMPRPFSAPTVAMPASAAMESEDPTSGFPPQLERPDDDHSDR